MAPERALQALALPARLGKYEIVSQLGLGGMARVYLALHRTPLGSKLVVIKQVRAELAEEADTAAMFIDEARVALRLSHRNVIHAYEAASEAGHQYLAMEFLEGKTLAQLLRAVGHEQMPLRVHLWVLSEVLGGLHYAHGLTDFDGTPLGIVHRDVSPSNVFVTRNGDVKLLDFGIAKLSGAMAETRDGIIKGKIGYAAPEQCQSRTVDARADVYAVGVMLWEALARRRLAPSETALAILQGRVPDFQRDLSRITPPLPLALQKIAQLALALEPQRRYQSAAAFQRDLSAYLGTLSGPAPNRMAAQLLELHFAAEFASVRRLIEQQMEGPRSAASIRVSRAPSSQGSHRESAPASRRTSPSRTVPRASRRQIRAGWPLIAGPLFLFAAVGLSTWREPAAEHGIVRPTADSRDAAHRERADAANLAALPRTVLVSELPLEVPVRGAPATTTNDGPRSANPASAARRPFSHSAPSSLHRTPNSAPSARAPSASQPALTSQAQLVEPGTPLTPRIAHASTHSLDEKDPYLP